MAKQKFEKRNLAGPIDIALEAHLPRWAADKAELINDIISIINRYRQAGYTLTLRQLYYQLVAADLIPNHDKVYKKIGGILDDCRYAGLVDWNAIEDRGRVPHLPYWSHDIHDAINDTIKQYRLNRMEGQDQHIEVWTEKDAISGILKTVTEKYHIRLVVNKGYTSSSAAYKSYKRFVNQINEGIPVRVLYFGDHDPSGLDMIRDIRERSWFFLSKGKDCLEYFHATKWSLDNKDKIEAYASDPNFKEYEAYAAKNKIDIGQRIWLHHNFQVIPIGLTMDQIKEYNLPHNPAKITDPRAADYVRQHGKMSWEVDALKPDIMVDLVDSKIRDYIDLDRFHTVVQREANDKIILKKFSDNLNDDENN